MDFGTLRTVRILSHFTIDSKAFSSRNLDQEKEELIIDDAELDEEEYFIKDEQYNDEGNTNIFNLTYS